MNAWARSIVAVLTIGTAPFAPASPLKCPTAAPSEWGLSNARLVSVDVFYYDAGTPLPADKTLLSVMAPDQRQDGDTWRQSWNMNFDAPKYQFWVDCLFSNTDRYMRLNAARVTQCLAQGNDQKRTFLFRCW